MAQLAPFGFQAGQSRRSVNEYYVPASDTSTLAVGDVVKTNGNVFVGRLPDSRVSNGMLHVTKASPGDSVRGVVVGVAAGPDDNSQQSLPSIKRRAYTLLVNDNPQALWDVQANNTAMLSAMAGMYASYTISAPSGSVSSIAVDSSSIGLDVRDLLIVEVLKNNGPNSLLRVAFVQHELAAIGGSPLLSARVRTLLSGDGIAKLSAAASATAVGTYAGTGAALTVTVGFVPTLFMVKDVSAATALAWTVNGANWNGRTSTFRNELTLDNGIAINKDGTVTIGTNAAINTNTNNYEWFAFGDNGRNCLILRDHAGNDQATRTLRHTTGEKLKAAIWKRDSSVFPLAAIRGKSSRLVDGSASAAAVTINEDGTINIDGNSNEINIWSGSSGESTAMLGFRDGAESIYVTTYTGNGGTLNLQTPFDDNEALLIFPRGASGKAGAFWTSRLAAGTTLSVSNETAATVGASCVASQSNGRFVLSTDARVNSNGIEYMAIAFRKQRIAPGQPVDWRLPRRLRSTAHFVLPSGTYFNAGTSDTLAINGPITLEWWGAHFNQTTGGLTAGAGINNTTTQQQALMWRSDGADATEGAVSYGIALINPLSPLGTGTDSSPVIAVPTSGFFDLPQTSTTSVDNNAPWMTGIRVPMRTLQHVMAVHLGDGFWNIFLNGQLVKERNRNNLLAGTPRPNIQSGSGHTFCFGARKRASTPELANYFYAIYGARVYNRGLSVAEARANYEALYDDNSSLPAAGFVEEWLASNATSTAMLPASRNAANNAVTVGVGAVLSGF